MPVLRNRYGSWIAALLAASTLVACGPSNVTAPDGGATDATPQRPDACGARCLDARVDPPEEDAGETPPAEDASAIIEDDAAVPPDAPDGAPTGAVLPGFDAETDAHVRDLVARGADRGNRRDVFAKVGDSITESASFLFDCGFGWYALGAHAGLEPTIRYFAAQDLGEGRNSLNRASLSAAAGWTTEDALMGGEASPLARELDATRPQWAIVMYGTNDLDRMNMPRFRANLVRVVDVIESRATVPVLSTIPPRMDTAVAGAAVDMFNAAIRSVARERHVPLLDYHQALSSLPGAGLSDDGIHPSVFEMNGGCQLTEAGLQHGYNVRNLTALEMLARLRGM